MCVCVCVCVCCSIGDNGNLSYNNYVFFFSEMYVNEVFLIICSYTAVSLTLVKE